MITKGRKQPNDNVESLLSTNTHHHNRKKKNLHKIVIIIGGQHKHKNNTVHIVVIFISLVHFNGAYKYGIFFPLNSN